MRHFTTVCDINYLPQGLALYHSLMRVNPDFTLYWGCMDQQTLDKVSGIPNVTAYMTWNIFEQGGFSYKEYAWSLASRFTNFIQDRHSIDIAYLDADLYFYQDYEHIFKEIAHKSIGLVEHRLPKYKTVGKYNVGFVYFKYDFEGRSCLERWAKLVSDKGNEHFEEYGSCGDQKYLELFPVWFTDYIHVINCGHGAWWNNRYYDFMDDSIVWNGETQLFIYMHFSHFHLQDNDYIHDEMAPMSKRLERYYNEYADEVRKHDPEFNKE